MKFRIFITGLVVFFLFGGVGICGKLAWQVFPKPGKTVTINVAESVFAGSYTPSMDYCASKNELVYTGHEGTIVHFIYREFTAGREYGSVILREAFSLPITYDLSKEKGVGYLGLRMELSNPTNKSIEVKMIEHWPEYLLYK